MEPKHPKSDNDSVDSAVLTTVGTRIARRRLKQFGRNLAPDRWSGVSSDEDEWSGVEMRQYTSANNGGTMQK